MVEAPTTLHRLPICRVAANNLWGEGLPIVSPTGSQYWLPKQSRPSGATPDKLSKTSASQWAEETKEFHAEAILGREGKGKGKGKGKAHLPSVKPHAVCWRLGAEVFYRKLGHQNK